MQRIMFHGLPDLPQAYLKEVGLTQNQEIVTLQNLITIFDLLV